jgi:hypothetical protein
VGRAGERVPQLFAFGSQLLPRGVEKEGGEIRPGVTEPCRVAACVEEAWNRGAARCVQAVEAVLSSIQCLQVYAFVLKSHVRKGLARKDPNDPTARRCATISEGKHSKTFQGDGEFCQSQESGRCLVQGGCSRQGTAAMPGGCCCSFRQKSCLRTQGHEPIRLI